MIGISVQKQQRVASSLVFFPRLICVDPACPPTQRRAAVFLWRKAHRPPAETSNPTLL
ncbi:MAG: hypothetical protein Q9172_006743 [Xanthocarpia lactea]